MPNQEPKSKPEDVEEPREEVLDETTCYPSSEGWWWIVGPDGYSVPVSVEKRGPRQVLSVCIPRCSTHCDKWWRPLQAIRGKWRGRVQLPLENADVEAPPRRTPNQEQG